MTNTPFVTLHVSDAPEMRMFVAVPQGKPKGGLLLFQEAFGVGTFIQGVAERLAAEGYLVAAPELYHRTAQGFVASEDEFEIARPHMNALTDAGLEADIRATYAWLRGQAGLENGSISSLGFCMGGRISFLANSILQLTSAISFYGGGIASMLDRVPNLSGPMLLVWAGLDARITAAQRHSISEAFDAAKKPYVEALFSDAEHGFFNHTRSVYQVKASEIVWPLVLQYLKTNSKK